MSVDGRDRRFASPFQVVPERAVACKQTVNHRWAAATVGGRQILEMPRHEPHPKIRTGAPKPPPDNKLERRCAITSAQS